jgi:4a-hydroxytetrahydrobiopterin dehydratase
MSELASKHCVPCRGGVPALKGNPLHDLEKQVPGWKVVNEHHLTRTYEFPDFKSALDLVNRIGNIAEQEGHHPNICFTWGKVEVTIYTHKIDGLTESDFILAAKIETLPRPEKRA